MTSGPSRELWAELAASRTARSEAWYFTRRAASYRANETYTNATVGETASLLVSNPDGSGVTLVLWNDGASAFAQSLTRIYDAFDGDPSGGSAVDVENNLLDAGGEGAFDSGIATVQRDVSFTATNTYATDPIGDGIGAGAGAGHSTSTPILIEPGRRVVIEVEKLRDGNDEVVINAEWYERKGVLSAQNDDPPESELST